MRRPVEVGLEHDVQAVSLDAVKEVVPHIAHQPELRQVRAFGLSLHLGPLPALVEQHVPTQVPHVGVHVRLLHQVQVPLELIEVEALDTEGGGAIVDLAVDGEEGMDLAPVGVA